MTKTLSAQNLPRRSSPEEPLPQWDRFVDSGGRYVIQQFSEDGVWEDAVWPQNLERAFLIEGTRLMSKPALPTTSLTYRQLQRRVFDRELQLPVIWPHKDFTI